MIRRFVKTAFASAVSLTRSERLVGSAPDRRRRPFIVCYHRVVEDARSGPRDSLPAMLITVKTLERHVDWLRSRFDLISLDEAGERFAGRTMATRPAAAITFDDGYQDVYDLAVPLLTRKGVPAAVFVVSDRVGSNGRHMHDRIYLLVARLFRRGDGGALAVAAAVRDAEVESPEVLRMTLDADDPIAATERILARLDQAELARLVLRLEEAAAISTDATPDHALMDWPALAAMARAGFTIGSHGRTHALLAHESASTVLHELLGSRLEIERHLGVPVRHVAYPAGSYDGTAVRLAAASGYRYGYACCGHADPHLPQLTIPRRVFWENTAAGPRGAFSPALLTCQAYDVLGFGVRCPGHARRARPAEPAAAPAQDTAAWRHAGHRP